MHRTQPILHVCKQNGGASELQSEVKIAPNNPTNNVLPPSTSEDAISEALAASGYPLQVKISRMLYEMISEQKGSQVVEEWVFIDRETQKSRAIDILCELRLPWNPADKTYPLVSLLIECKASSQPLVFFESPSPYDLTEMRAYPKIVGLPHQRIRLKYPGPVPYADVVPQQLIAVKTIPRLIEPSAHASVFTKVILKGKKAEVQPVQNEPRGASTSGADAYQNIVLPLTKAVQHYDATKMPAKGYSHFQAVALFAVAVFEGPLMYSSQVGQDLVMAPWIRLSRHEYIESNVPVYRDGLLAIDVVHASFFRTYLTEFIQPFASAFGVNVRRQAAVLANGVGVLPRFAYDDQFFHENATVSPSEL